MRERLHEKDTARGEPIPSAARIYHSDFSRNSPSDSSLTDKLLLHYKHCFPTHFGQIFYAALANWRKVNP